MNAFVVPPNHIVVGSISGGKDSAALGGWMKRMGLTPRILFGCNTGNEADFTTTDGIVVNWGLYMRELEAALGESIEILEADVLFDDRVLLHNTFPGRVKRRWCTPELKIDPFRVRLEKLREDTGLVPIVALGIRAEESNERALMPEWEWSETYDCKVWRPLLDWTLKDVIAEHHRDGLPLNPLYKLGAERVGCWPCIKAGKREIRLVSELDPKRIQQIRDLEAKTGTTMFCLERSRAGGAPRKLIPTKIDDMIAWSKTARGGKLHLPTAEPSGCARWGICEPPVKEDC